MTDPDEITDVLVIDDDDLTAELVERALRSKPGRSCIVSAHDGCEGLQRMRGRNHVIFVFMTADAEEDDCRACQRCVAGYIRKSEFGRRSRDGTRLASTYCNTVYLSE